MNSKSRMGNHAASLLLRKIPGCEDGAQSPPIRRPCRTPPSSSHHRRHATLPFRSLRCPRIFHAPPGTALRRCGKNVQPRTAKKNGLLLPLIPPFQGTSFIHFLLLRRKQLSRHDGGPLLLPTRENAARPGTEQGSSPPHKRHRSLPVSPAFPPEKNELAFPAPSSLEKRKKSTFR